MLANPQSSRSERVARMRRGWQPPGRRLGLRHYARIVLLLVVTGLLTWYARRGRNNPFGPSQTVLVTGDNTHHLIRYASSDSALGNEIVLLLDAACEQGSGKCGPPVSSWSLITLGEQQIWPEYFQTPPTKWLIVHPGTGSGSTEGKYAPGWPQPVRVERIARQARMSVRWVHAVDDSSARMVWAEFGKIRMVVGTRAHARCTNDLSDVLRERADVAVFSGVSEPMAFGIRQCLRPLYLVTVPAGSCVGDSCRDAGILSPTEARYAYRFRPSTGGGVLLAETP